MTILREVLWHFSWNSNGDSDEIMWWCCLADRIHSDQSSWIHRWQRFKNEHYNDPCMTENLSERFLKIQDPENRKEEGELWNEEFMYVKSKIRLLDDKKGIIVLIEHLCGIIYIFLDIVGRLVTSMSMWFGTLRYRVVSFRYSIQYDNSSCFSCSLLFVSS